MTKNVLNYKTNTGESVVDVMLNGTFITEEENTINPVVKGLQNFAYKSVQVGREVWCVM
jgi:hypothetical protein